MDMTSSGVHPLVWVVVLSTVLALGVIVFAVRARSAVASTLLGMLALLLLVPVGWLFWGLFLK